jgi:hypothetical protein
VERCAKELGVKIHDGMHRGKSLDRLVALLDHEQVSLGSIGAGDVVDLDLVDSAGSKNKSQRKGSGPAFAESEQEGSFLFCLEQGFCLAMRQITVEPPTGMNLLVEIERREMKKSYGSLNTFRVYKQ